ncbi:MAG: lysophospholipase [Clostridia bacterium]|nr:lysophospholipase [Clostridia bacterium]
MGYTYKEISFSSSDGKNTVHAEMYIPQSEVRAVVQLSHGMIDYVGRYESLAIYLAERGIAFVGNDHLGHGKTAACADDLGYFAERDGYVLVIDDLYKMNSIVKETFPGVPVVMLGHSMGSFMARLYAVKYPESISALIIHGTGGANPLLAPGKILAKLLRAIYGTHHRSNLITNLAFGSYNSHYPKEEGENAWLTRDVARVATRQSDPFTNYKFTLSGYIDLFDALGKSNAREWYENYPKTLPTLVISGDDDPVGNYGKGVREVHAGLAKAGVARLTLKLYEGARHELFNEFNSDEVFDYLAGWIEENI